MTKFDGLEKLSLWVLRIVAALCGLVFAVLAAAGLATTALQTPDYFEGPYLAYDRWPLALAGAAAALLAAVFWARRLPRADKTLNRRLSAALVVYAMVLGVVWVCLAGAPPVADQAFVKNAALHLVEGNYVDFKPMGYLSQHSYLIGLCLFEAAFFSLFGWQNVLAFQLLNVLCAAAALWLCGRLADEIMPRDAAIGAASRLLGFFCWPLLLCCTFVYGNLLSLPLGFGALLLGVRAAKRGGLKNYALAALLMAAAKALKANILIFQIAAVLVWAFAAARRRSVKPLAAAAGLWLTCTAVQEGLLLLGEVLTGESLHCSEPMVAWLAMGLQEGPLGNGWYNEYVDVEYILRGGDAAAITADAMQSLRENVLNFLRSPGYTLRFFSQKLATQWCEPTYEGFWCSNNIGDGRVVPTLAGMLYHGKTHRVVVAVLDAFQFVSFGFAALALWLRRKCWTMPQLLPAVTVLGGFCYSMLAEAKSMYNLPYALLLLPYAGCGLVLAARAIAKR